MNFLKSLFIFVSPVLLLFIVLQGLLVWLDSKNLILSLGIVLSALPLLLFLSYIMLFRKLARTGRHLLAVSIPSLIGVVLIISQGYQTWLMTLAGSGLLISLIYIYLYSDNGRENNSDLGVGRTLPKFEVQESTGTKVSSDSFHSKRSLIFFYRGNWCPLCMAQIDEVAAQYKKFEENDIDVIFIAPQSSKNTKKLASKFNLGFQFYTDKNNKAAKQLGILHKFGLPMGFQVLGYESDSVYPTIIALGDVGKIIYCDQTSNYRVRPEPEDLFKVFSI